MQQGKRQGGTSNGSSKLRRDVINCTEGGSFTWYELDSAYRTFDFATAVA